MKLRAQGLQTKDIAKRLVVAIKTAEYHISAALDRMKVKSSAQAVFKAAELGILNLDEFTEGFNLQAITTLTPSELRILEAMSNEYESIGNDENNGLADLLVVSEKTIIFHKTHIFKKLGINNHIRAVLFYMAARKADLFS